MKKYKHWLLVVAATPIVLFLLLAFLLYCQPIQNWAVKKVAAYASQKTGMEITVEHVRLIFPLNLAVENVKVLQPNDSLPQRKDTVAVVGTLVVDVALMPLFDKQVEVNALTFRKMVFDTTHFIHEARVQGRAGVLSVQSKGIDLAAETAKINYAVLRDAEVRVELSDTVPPDTAKSEMRWKINVEKLTIQNTGVEVRLPGDTLRLKTHLGNVAAAKGSVDLGKSAYTVRQFNWTDGTLTYDNRFAKAAKGIDANHLSLTEVGLRIDSLSFIKSALNLKLRHCTFKEKSGIAVKKAAGVLAMDSTRLRLPAFLLHTPHSSLRLRLDMDLNTFAEQQPGRMFAEFHAGLGKQDLLLGMADMPRAFKQSFPNAPLTLEGTLRGNLQRMTLEGGRISLPGAFRLWLDGYLSNATNARTRRGEMTLKAETYQLAFVKSLLPAATAKMLRIPPRITLSARAKMAGSFYDATFKMTEGGGVLSGKASFDAARTAYRAQIDARRVAARHFLTNMPLHPFTGKLMVQGAGTDFFSPKTQLKAQATVVRFGYDVYNLDSLSANISLKAGRAIASFDCRNELLKGTIKLEALMSTKPVDVQMWCDVSKADLYRLQLTQEPLLLSLQGNVGLRTDLKHRYKVEGRIHDMSINDSTRRFNPHDIVFDAETRRDTTFAVAQCGDFRLQLDAKGGYETLLRQGVQLASAAQKQLKRKHFDYPLLRKHLPHAHLLVETGHDNLAMKILGYYGYRVGSMSVDMQSSPNDGLNGSASAYGLSLQNVKIDTVRFDIRSQENGLSYLAQVRNGKKNPQYTFNALLNGSLHDKEMELDAQVYDGKNKLGLAFSVLGEMEDKGIRFKLGGDHVVLGYKRFNVNDSNYVFLSDTQRIYADVGLQAADKTSIHLYSNDENHDVEQDLTLSLQQFDVEKLLSIVPYMPKMQGVFNGDVHLTRKDNEFALSSAVSIAGMSYERCPMGNLSTEFVYIPRSDGSHSVNGHLLCDDEEIALVEGTFNPDNKDALDVRLELNRAPMSLVNGFIPQQLIGLKGYAEGTLTVKGSTSAPIVNGEVFLDSAYLVSVPYGIELRMDNDPVRIVNSRLLFENFNLYSHNEQPLITAGYFDFSNLDRMSMDVRMKATNYLLIDAEESSRATAFGKAYVNFLGRISGELSQLNMRGKLDVLGSTDMTYVMLDSPLNNDNRFEGLVKFVDFREKTPQVVTKPTLNGLAMDLALSIDNGANIRCDLNTDHTNYVKLVGGGDLRMRYNTADNITITGKYQINSGEMKYSLPVIPLKTFTIQEGSYVEFNGDAMNPSLNITATERNKASVNTDGGVRRTALFTCGVVVTKTLKDMGLEFIISCPEDATVSNQLQAMSKEERGKVAVTMLTTGMYLASGNAGAFSVNSSLNDFLQSQINAISGNALRTLDLSFGMNNSTDASGSSHTDYSIKFAKRFLNNRLNVIVGGSISSGNNTTEANKDTFFDNVTFEYRLSPVSNQYLKLFYQRDAYDWLEGYVGEYGGGFMWRRKLQHFRDIFRFKSEKAQSVSISQDSVKVKK